MITRPTYATREDLRTAIDVKTTARNNAALDRALEAGAEAVETCTRRVFWPWTGTRYFDWPSVLYPTPWRLWLDEDEVSAVTSITSGGTTELYSAGNILLYPNQGPPYTRLELDRNASFAFAGGTSPQRGVAVLGVFGHSNRTRSVTTVAEALDDTETEVQITSAEGVGVGDLILVDSERMLVTERSWLTTGLTVSGGGLSNGSTGVTLTASSTGLVAGEIILVDSERMLVEDVVGTAATVKRAYDGSVLAAHTAGTTIYAQRSLTVQRGTAGTTAAAHSTSATLAVQTYPPLVRTLNLGEALNYLVSENTAWARVIGSSEYAREYTGRGLDGLRMQAKRAHGRRNRTAAV